MFIHSFPNQPLLSAYHWLPLHTERGKTLSLSLRGLQSVTLKHLQQPVVRREMWEQTSQGALTVAVPRTGRRERFCPGAEGAMVEFAFAFLQRRVRGTVLPRFAPVAPGRGLWMPLAWSR